MFFKRFGLTSLGLGLITAGVVACQGQQASTLQENEPGQPIALNGGGFEGIETTNLALLANACDTSSTPVVVKVAAGEFAYLFLRSADNNVVVNANNSGGSQCVFAASKSISIVAAENTGTSSHKVLIDYLSGSFAVGNASAVGITVDLKTTGVNQVMFRGTTDQDIFVLGTKNTTSYVAFASAPSSPSSPTFPSVSLANVSDVTISTGPGDDVITGQATGLTSPSGVGLFSGNINLTVFGGDGNDQITSGSKGTGKNSLNGNAGSDVFYQPVGSFAQDIISGGSDPSTTVTTIGTSTSTTTAANMTATQIATNTLTDSQTGSKTASFTGTGTVTAAFTGTKTGTLTTSGTASATQTATGTATFTMTYNGTGTANGVKTFTATMTATDTVSATMTITASGTASATASKTATASAIGSGTSTVTQTYTTQALNYTATSVQTDTSVDVVDYSLRTTAIKVTLGDEAASAAVAASGTITVPNSDAINSYDSFLVNDGTTSKLVEFHKSSAYAVGTMTIPANGSDDLANDDTFTINDGSHSVVFHLLIAGGTSTNTDTNANIVIAASSTKADVADAIAAGIKTYQTATWTGTATGTATMTSTSIIPNVTVSEDTTTKVISVQDRNVATPTTFLAKSSTNLAVTTGSTAQLWNNGDPAGNSSIVVMIADASADSTTVASSTQAAIGASTLNVTAAVSGSIVTLTEKGGAAVTSGFNLTLKSGGFDLAIVTKGTASTGAGYNDGDIAANSGAGEQDSIAADVEVVIGSQAGDTIDATWATNTPHTLFGMSGDDILIIGAGSTVSNVLYGGPGNDHLVGGSGVDTLYGGDGDDYVAGGPGNDVIDGDGANCLVASTGVYASSLCIASYAAASSTPGSNYLDYSDRTASVTVNLATLATASQIGATGEKDSVTNCTNLRGGSGADTLTGDSGANIIYGGPGDDTIRGGGGNDTLYGDSGDDLIYGEAGNDFIYGGSGVNTLNGDDPSDTTIVGINMLDNSAGRKGAVNCGSSDMNILFSDGAETGTATCFIK